MLVLVNDRRLMGEYVNGPVRNVVAGVTAAALTALSVAMIAISVF
jgi:Mn2+/Fe2+ NRAMP family transporter